MFVVLWLATFAPSFLSDLKLKFPPVRNWPWLSCDMAVVARARVKIKSVKNFISDSFSESQTKT